MCFQNIMYKTESAEQMVKKQENEYLLLHKKYKRVKLIKSCINEQVGESYLIAMVEKKAHVVD